jgi:hypothetical protein
MFQDELKQYVLDNPRLVSMKPAGDGLFVLKYKKTVFYNNSWNEFLEHCRGTIVDKDFNIVSYPFQKIYNLGVEDRAPKLSEFTKVTAFRKVNGFMIAMSWYRDRLIVSTTGSTDNDYVDMAEELMGENRARFESHCRLHSDHTFMFECVHRDDPHIVPETEGLYLLGSRKKEWHSAIEHDPFVLDNHANAFGTIKVGSITTTLDQLERMTKICRHEGHVFYTDDGVSAKIKSPYYLTSKWVARNPRTDKIMNLQADIKKSLDEEYHNLIDAIRLNIVEYTAMTEQERLAWVREQLS